jgi:hypothetical protein
LRVGDLRVIYLVMDEQRLVVITRVAKRQSVRTGGCSGVRGTGQAESARP